MKQILVVVIGVILSIGLVACTNKDAAIKEKVTTTKVEVNNDKLVSLQETKQEESVINNEIESDLVTEEHIVEVKEESTVEVSNQKEKPESTTPQVPKSEPVAKKPVTPPSTKPKPQQPSRQSGIDEQFSLECYITKKTSGSNCNYPVLISELDAMVNDAIFNQRLGLDAIKSMLENYKPNDFKVVCNAQVEMLTVNNAKEFSDRLEKTTVDNYLYVKAYYNADKNAYDVYYVGCTLEHVQVYKAGYR